jgi:hypothetical protein
VLLAGGLAIVGTGFGVSLAYVLEVQRENRQRRQSELREIYDGLKWLSARLQTLVMFGSYLPKYSGISEEKYKEEIGAKAVELSILVTKSECIPEAADILRLCLEVVPQHFDNDVLRGIDEVADSIEGRLSNQDYISARNTVRDESEEERRKAIKEINHGNYTKKKRRGKRK